MFLNETFLNEETADNKLLLEGYTLVARKDRPDNSAWGGVLAFARTGLEERVVLLETSETHERVWLAVHTKRGPYLFSAWYRLPAQGDATGVQTLKEELARLSEDLLRTTVVGDLNVYSFRWL